MPAGRKICDLIPCEENNRNSEGSFIQLKNKDILFVYSRYGGNGLTDHATSDLYGIISHDDGESFGEPFPVMLHEDLKADNLMSVSFIRMNNDDIGMFFLKKNNKDGERHLCIPYFVRSADEGKTWSEPICCVDEKGYYVLNNDRMLKLGSGRLLMPLARYTENEVFTICIYASDDDGNSWHCLAKDIGLPVSSWRYPYSATAEEPGLAVFADGTIWCYIRTVLGHQYEMFSKDNGETWTIPAPSQFTSPASPMCVKKISGGLFTVWNPVPMYNGKTNETGGVWTGGRNPLCFTLLDENGVLYQPAAMGLTELPIMVNEIENDERRGFCYTAIYELENGDILLGYCSGEKYNHCLSTITIRKIKKQEIR